MGIILRVDIEKAYGNHTLIRKVLSKVIENYYPTAPIIFGYLDHLKIIKYCFISIVTDLQKENILQNN